MYLSLLVACIKNSSLDRHPDPWFIFTNTEKKSDSAQFSPKELLIQNAASFCKVYSHKNFEIKVKTHIKLLHVLDVAGKKRSF